MEIQLQELIEKIKSDGVAAAQQEAEAKLEEANAAAAKIVADAKAEAAKLIADAKEENARMVKSSEDAIRQAGRNQLITFRESVTRELDAIIGERVAQSYSKETLAKLIPAAVETWTKNSGASALEVLLGADDLAALENDLKAELKQRLCAGVTLRADERLEKGFRIASKDGSAYYDYSADAVAEMLSQYLSPRVAALMKEAAKG